MNKYSDNKEPTFTKYVIIVPTQYDRLELMEAFKHIHYSDVDTDYVAVNQLVHEYLDETENAEYHNNILVDAELYEQLTKTIAA